MGTPSTQYPFLAHPALDPRGFAFAVQPDWADLVAERDLVASRTPALGADYLGAVASLSMEICVPTVRTVPNLIFQCVKRDDRRSARRAIKRDFDARRRFGCVPVTALPTIGIGGIGGIGDPMPPMPPMVLGPAGILECIGRYPHLPTGAWRVSTNPAMRVPASFSSCDARCWRPRPCGSAACFTSSWS